MEVAMRTALVLLLAGVALLAGCSNSNDSGNGSSLATVHGTVTLHGDWPANGDIQVSLFSTWHTELPVNIAPQGPPDFATDPLDSPTPVAQEHLVHFEIPDINPGTYPSLTVGWRDGGQQGLDEPVLGLYGGDFAAGDTLPEAVHLAAGDDRELNFEGWLDRIPEVEDLQPGQVGGVVQFTDSWPTTYASYFVLLMSSANPAVPSQPLAMEIVSASDAEFLLTVQFAGSLDCHIAVYGYPYGNNPAGAFFGGYGWDWNAGTPALQTITLQEGQSGVGGLVLSCRSGE
jgi:hypothetical protein